MKKSIFAVAAIVSAFACSNPQPEHAAVPDKVSKTEESKIILAEGMLVSTNDTVCGMPIGNEPGDTLTYDGKLFGFCSTGCKDAFVAEHTKK
jgi:YHS domain-containing protein